MIEVYAFLAMFPVQILAMSVLHPAWFTKYVRMHAKRYPAERLAQFYPGVDLDVARERFLTQYRAANTGIAVLGLLLLAWLFDYMLHPAWEYTRVIALLAAYGMLQVLPIIFVAWSAACFKMKVLTQSLPDAKRKATLQRRGLFDFVSPFVVSLAILGYFLFAAYVIFIQAPSFQGFALVGTLTLVYAFEAFVVYRLLYGKKINSVETNADSVRAIGLGVRICIYGCIVCVAFFSLTFTLDQLELHRWVPFALSTCLLAGTLLCFIGLTARPPQPEAAA